MINRHYKFSIGLSVLISILIVLSLEFKIFPGIVQTLMLIVMSGLILGLFIEETTLIQYSKSALRESLLFGLIFGVIFGNFFLFFDRGDGMAALSIWNVSLTILVFFTLGFALSFFGLLIGVIPKYFSSLKIRR